MEHLTAKREIGVITAEIITIREQTNRMVLDNSIEIGRRLCEAKEIVGHGAWGDYLREQVAFSPSTANNLMRIYEEYGDNQLELGKAPKSQTFGNLTYSKAVALLALPDEAREDVVIENDVAKISVKELQEIIENKKLELMAAREEAEKARREADGIKATADTAAKERERLDKKLAQAAAKLEKAEKDAAALRLEKERLEAQAGQVPPERVEVIRQEAQKAAADKIAAAQAEGERQTAAERIRAEELAKKLAVAGDADAVTLNVYFKELQEDLDKLYAALERVSTNNAEAGEKFRSAILKFAEIFRQKFATKED